MVIKSYKDVSPTTYEGVAEGVQIREMITAQDGAPTFAMRVFDVTPGAATPYHTHGCILFPDPDGCEQKEQRQRSRPAIRSTLLRTNDTALWRIPAPRFK